MPVEPLPGEHAEVEVLMIRGRATRVGQAIRRDSRDIYERLCNLADSRQQTTEKQEQENDHG